MENCVGYLRIVLYSSFINEYEVERSPVFGIFISIVDHYRKVFSQYVGRGGTANHSKLIKFNLRWHSQGLDVINLLITIYSFDFNFCATFKQSHRLYQSLSILNDVFPEPQYHEKWEGPQDGLKDSMSDENVVSEAVTKVSYEWQRDITTLPDLFYLVSAFEK